MAAKSSRKAFIALLVGAATVAIATSSATTLTVLLLNKFNNAEFKDEDLKEGNKLLYYFVPRLRPALPYY